MQFSYILGIPPAVEIKIGSYTGSRFSSTIGALVGTKKMTPWLVPKMTKLLEWDDDPVLPEMEEIGEIEKRELARIHREKIKASPYQILNIFQT